MRKVLVEEASSVGKELYLSLVVDRSRGKECAVFMALERSGVVVEKNPAEIGRRVQEILKATSCNIPGVTWLLVWEWRLQDPQLGRASTNPS